MIQQKKKKKLWIITAFVLILFLILPMGICICVYEQNFGVRFEPYAPLDFHLENFPGLKRRELPFPSNHGQTLAGYLYYTEDTPHEGIVVISHGLGGGGHTVYMDCANFFAHNGYYVFAYDATGNGESEGRSTVGLSQGLIDLDYALSHIQTQEDFRDLPIMLFGHSWGGYAVANVLNYHPEVKAVVSICGFNRAADLLEARGCEILGPAAKLLVPYVNAYEYLKFGGYSTSTAMDGFQKSDAAVFVIHSQDDTTVPQEYGYDIYREAYGDSDRFTFVHYTDKGHSNLYFSQEYLNYIASFNASYAQWQKTWPDDLTGEEKVQYRAAYLQENLDRAIYCNRLDKKLFGEMLAFYDANLN